MLISEALGASLQGDKVQNVSLSLSSMHSISEALPLYFGSWRHFCWFCLVQLLHMGIFSFHFFFFLFFWWLCFPAVSMSLPTKVLNTHRKSLNLVDNPHFFETKVSCGNFYAVCVFRMQHHGLSCVSQPNPMLILIFFHRQAIVYSLGFKFIFWLGEGFLVKYYN